MEREIKAIDILDELDTVTSLILVEKPYLSKEEARSEATIKLQWKYFNQIN